MKRLVAYCKLCRHRRYCELVHVRHQSRPSLEHIWLCRLCCRTLGVRPALTLACPWSAVVQVLRQEAALASASPSAIRSNPDGTITCIWITPVATGEQP